MLAYLLVKWFFTPVCLFLGVYWLHLAYQKRHQTEAFRIGDLFASIRLYDKTKQQLVAEGLVLIILGSAGIIFFSHH